MLNREYFRVLLLVFIRSFRYIQLKEFSLELLLVEFFRILLFIVVFRENQNQYFSKIFMGFIRIFQFKKFCQDVFINWWDLVCEFKFICCFCFENRLKLKGIEGMKYVFYFRSYDRVFQWFVRDFWFMRVFLCSQN